MKKFTLALATLSTLTIAACQPTNISTPNEIPDLTAAVSSPVISVFNHQGKPVAGAQVLIGRSAKDPFAGNVLITDAQGRITAPKAWTSSQPVTVVADGFVRVTYLDLKPGSALFSLRPIAATQQLELKGNVTGLPIKNKDGYADFSMVMPALTKADILSFDLNQIVSPTMDVMTAMGKSMPVPSNVSFPKQTESYLFFSITLDKPVFRLYFGNAGTQRVYALSGRFPFKSTADGMMGDKSFLELLNNFEFTAGSVRDANLVAGSSASLDIPTQEMRFTNTLEVQAPKIANDESYLAVAVSAQNNYMVPTDVRLLKSQERMRIRQASAQESLYLAAVKKTADLKEGGSDRMSAALLPTTSNTQPELLSLIGNPTPRDSGLVLPVISPIAGVMPIGTKLVYSVEQEFTQGREKIKVFSPQWEIYSTNWETLVSLPNMDTTAGAQKKRWEVKFIGGLGPSQITHGPAMIEHASHVTQSSIEF